MHTNIKFAYSTNAFKHYSLDDALQAISDLGFRGAEIMADRPHLYPPDYFPGKTANLKRRLARLSLEIANINTFTITALSGRIYHPSWIEPDESHREARVEHTRQCLGLAAQLGCPTISTMAGGQLPPGMDRADALGLFVEGITLLIPEAHRLNVKILIEPEPGTLIATSAECEEFFGLMNSPSVGLNCDIGHFFALGEDPLDVLRRFSHIIGNVHVEDIKDGMHEHLICGRGDIDFAPVIDFIHGMDYGRFLTVELYNFQDNPEEAGRESLEFLKRVTAEELKCDVL